MRRSTQPGESLNPAALDHHVAEEHAMRMHPQRVFTDVRVGLSYNAHAVLVDSVRPQTDVSNFDAPEQVVTKGVERTIVQPRPGCEALGLP